MRRGFNILQFDLLKMLNLVNFKVAFCYCVKFNYYLYTQINFKLIIILMKKFLLPIFAILTCLQVNADTILLNETFDAGDYNKSFPYVYEGDGLEPNSAISSMFLSASTGTYQPWWILKDSDTSPNTFYGSHSYYAKPGQSNDWMISIPLEIPTPGFYLNFEAQSFTFGFDESKLSDLSLYITETEIDPKNLPTLPTYVFEKVPQGATTNIDGEFTKYSYCLDEYVGKTIYINFANQNYDKEILCIDNVQVVRIDKGRMTIQELDKYTTEETFSVNATITAMTSEDLTNWKVVYNDGVNTFTEEGETLASGESKEISFIVPIELGTTVDYSVSFTADDMPETRYSGSIGRVSYFPFRKILLEESTGTWCGYCPSAAYNVACMQEDEEMGEYVVAVAVHANGTPNDQMVLEYYDNALGVTSQPTFVVNRKDQFSMNASHDTKFDKTNPMSFAYRVTEMQKEPTILDVEVEGDWVLAGPDTIAINCHAKVKTAFPTKNNRYSLLFILTENNVYMPNNGNWNQQNYYSGTTEIEGDLGGWTKLPKSVANVRYHDVARGIWNVDGIPNSLPEIMNIDTEYTYDFEMEIPNTYLQSSNGKVIRPAIKCEYCEIICAVIDNVTGEIMNVDSYPMSEVAENRFSIEDLVNEFNGIEEIGLTDSVEGDAVYFDMQGRQVVNPENGIYIKRVGSKATKVVVR